MRYETLVYLIDIILMYFFHRYRFRTSNTFDLNACFDVLLKAGADVNKADKNGTTALIKAAESGSTWCVNALLAAGARVNKFDNEGFSPLMSATCANNSEVVGCLIKAGAKINIASESKSKGQMWLGRTQNNRAISCRYPLIATASPYRQESSKIIDMLIAVGADVNVADREGKTTLHLIIRSRYSFEKLRTVRLLIAAGADVNRFDNSGDTPLSCVHEVDCARELLLAGAQINRTKPFDLDTFVTSHIRNSLKYGIKPSPARDTDMLLFASGESRLRVPESLQPSEPNLMHLCRKTIRKHLLKLDPHTHLFSRVPQLGLPTLLNNYLLYDVTCAPSDENDEEVETDDEIDDRL